MIEINVILEYILLNLSSKMLSKKYLMIKISKDFQDYIPSQIIPIKEADKGLIVFDRIKKSKK